jgi:hypothetical protein
MIPNNPKIAPDAPTEVMGIANKNQISDATFPTIPQNKKPIIIKEVDFNSSKRTPKMTKNKRFEAR